VIVGLPSSQENEEITGEMLEDNVYMQRNEELSNLIATFGPRYPGPGRALANDPVCERGSFFTNMTELPWLQMLAGALGYKSVEELYDREELERAVRECRERVERRRARVRSREAGRERLVERGREVGERRGALVAERERVEREAPRVNELGEIGERLVESFLALRATELDLTILLGERLSQPSVKERLQAEVRVIQATRLSEPGDEALRAEFRTQEELERHIFTPWKLFTLYLNNRAGAQSMRAIVESGGQTLRQMGGHVFHLRALFTGVGGPPSSQPPLPYPLPRHARIVETEPEEWSLLEGRETIFLPLLTELYEERAVKEMVTLGCRAAYTTHKLDQEKSRGTAYPTMILRYLFHDSARESELAKADLYRLSIYESGRNGWQPEAVMSLLHLVRREYNETVTRQVLIAHFVWCYFMRRSAAGLAHDWRAWGKWPTRETLQYEILEGLLVVSRAQLAEYLSLVATLLFIGSDVGGLHTIVEGRSLFRLPLTFASYDFSRPTRADDATRLDVMNGLFGQATTVVDLISNDTFRQFLGDYDGEKRIEAYGRLHYPVLGLHTLLLAYFQFMQRRLSAIEDGLGRDEPMAIIEDEGEDEEEEEEEPTPPTPPLTPLVTYFTRMAYGKVQDHCPGLRGLPEAEFKTQDALQSGLLCAYTTFVEALVAENNLSSQPARPKSLHQRRHTLQHSIDALKALKSYDYRRLPGGRYTTERVGSPHKRRRFQLF
jgi:hypothetical protein